MDIIQVVGIALITTFLVITIKEQNSALALLLAIFAGVAIFLSLLGEIAKVIRLLEHLANKADINTIYLQTILKIIGIAYIAEFGAQISRDAGQSSMASKSWNSSAGRFLSSSRQPSTSTRCARSTCTRSITC